MTSRAPAVWRRGLLLGGLMLSAGAAGAQASPAAGHGPYFPADAPWYQDVSTAPVDAESSTVINWLSSVGGWGGGRMQIDFSIEVLEADAGTPFHSFTPTVDFFDPDCDRAAMASVPVPAGGALEGETGYQCVSDGDCHLLVVHRPSHRLYEMWRAHVGGSTYSRGGPAGWDKDLPPPPPRRRHDRT